MPILLTRIDDRLIHGQVVVGWAQALKSNHIVVIDDDIAGNEMQKFLFRMATPTDIKLSILTIKEAAEIIKKRGFDEDYTILLLKSPENAYKLIKAGGKLSSINIGGMHFGEGKIQLFDAVFVDEKDIEYIELLNKEGVALEVRMVPTDQKKDVIKVIDEKIKKKENK
ncbi:MAG: PTS sugar transporter subunit IIB [Candidatus Goldbacteria bacterium]|nr:PTS sugar transporter subunit IIB [Candidatus Goldiibacteriota bacterium]